MTRLPRQLCPRLLPRLVLLACAGPLWIASTQAQTAGMELQGSVPARPARSEPAALPVGAPVRSNSLERTMLLLDDQPGLRVRPVLKPGAQFGQTDLEVDLSRRNQVSGELGLDNTGKLNTGQYRLHAAVNVNSPWRFGDRLALSALTTDRRLWLGSAEYDTPLDAGGTRGAIGISRSSNVLGGAFAALEASGIADTLSLRVSHAWLRSQQSNLLVSATMARKRLRQRFDALGEERKRTSTGLNLTLQFDRHDAWAGGGVVYGQLAPTIGRLSLDAASRGPRGCLDWGKHGRRRRAAAQAGFRGDGAAVGL